MKAPFKLKLITAPAVEPITDLDEVKKHLRIPVTYTKDNAHLTKLIKDARIEVEQFCDRALITQTWEMVFSSQPRKIDFPLGQLSSVTSIKTVADDESEVTESALIYTVEKGEEGTAFLKVGQTWTSTSRQYDFFKARFVAGYGNAGTDLPSNFIIAMKRLINNMYYGRETDIRKEKYIYSQLARYMILSM